VVSCSKVLVKHPLDTVTIRLQVAKRDTGGVPRREVLFRGLYDGVGAPLLFAIPSGSIFFSVKDFAKSELKKRGFSKEFATVLGVFIAQFPYWLVRNPSELIKTRVQGAEVSENSTKAGINVWDETKAVITEEGGVLGLYKGYGENIAAAFPADAIKFYIYEACTGGRPKNSVPPLEGAAWGALATAVAQAATTPFDVIRNRAMTETQQIQRVKIGDDTTGHSKQPFLRRYLDSLVEISTEEGIDALWTGILPRIAKALLSGAVQFGAYELSKGGMSNLLSKK